MARDAPFAACAHEDTNVQHGSPLSLSGISSSLGCVHSTLVRGDACRCPRLASPTPEKPHPRRQGRCLLLRPPGTVQLPAETADHLLQSALGDPQLL